MPDGQFDLPRAKEGGVDAMFFSIFVTEEYYPQRFETKQALRLIDLALTQLDEEPRHDRTGAQRRRHRAHPQAGKMAAVLDLEGGFDLDGDLGVLRDLYRLGLRSAQLPRTTGPTTTPIPAAPRPSGTASTSAAARWSAR